MTMLMTALAFALRGLTAHVIVMAMMMINRMRKMANGNANKIGDDLNMFITFDRIHFIWARTFRCHSVFGCRFFIFIEFGEIGQIYFYGYVRYIIDNATVATVNENLYGKQSKEKRTMCARNSC